MIELDPDKISTDHRIVSMVEYSVYENVRNESLLPPRHSQHFLHPHQTLGPTDEHCCFSCVAAVVKHSLPCFIAFFVLFPHHMFAVNHIINIQKIVALATELIRLSIKVYYSA